MAISKLTNKDVNGPGSWWTRTRPDQVDIPRSKPKDRPYSKPNNLEILVCIIH